MNGYRLLITIACLFLFSQASAVALNSGKEGQVLIFPYYNNLGGNSTLIQISRPLQGIGAANPKALKFHFYDRNGQRVFSFNLYMAESLWTAAIVSVNGQGQLILPKESCTVPQLGQGEASGVSVPLTSGFFEVIDMGAVTDQVTKDAVNNFECDRLESMWDTGGVWRNSDSGFQLAAPEGRLRGTIQLINAQEGTLYSIVASALTEFSDIAQHTPPESEVPNLSSPHDEGTESGNTRSVKCFESTHSCVEDTWARPKDAVAAVLSSKALSGEYSINDVIAAKADVLLLFPLQPFRSEGDASPEVRFDIAGVDARFLCAPLLYLNPCSAAYIIDPTETVYLSSFNDNADDFRTIVESDLLKDTHVAIFPEPGEPKLPTSGNFGLYLTTAIPQFLKSNLGNTYPGIPVIGYVFQKYSNGQLTDQQGQLIMANYGNVFELSEKGK